MKGFSAIPGLPALSALPSARHRKERRRRGLHSVQPGTGWTGTAGRLYQSSSDVDLRGSQRVIHLGPKISDVARRLSPRLHRRGSRSSCGRGQLGGTPVSGARGDGGCPCAPRQAGLGEARSGPIPATHVDIGRAYGRTAVGHGDADRSQTSPPVAICGYGPTHGIEAPARRFLEEVVRQLRFDRQLDATMASSICAACYLPSVNNVWSTRSRGDLRSPVPKGATNLGLTGRYVDVPREIGLTIECSVRTPWEAIRIRLNGGRRRRPSIRANTIRRRCLAHWRCWSVNDPSPRPHAAFSSPRTAGPLVKERWAPWVAMGTRPTCSR
jgi:hypothetical protein